jgi:hypothetical protein
VSRDTTTPTRKLSSGTRLVLAIVVSVVVIGALSIGVVGAAIYRAGTVDVEVVDLDGSNVSLRLPGALIHAGVQFVPDRLLSDAAHEAEPWLPAARAAWEGLEEYDEVVLVEVDGPHEKVRVAKRGGVLVIDVDDHGTEVHIAVPFRTVSLLIDKLDRALDV